LNDIEHLALCCGKLFIYAATLVRYIYPQDDEVNYSGRLETILKSPATSTLNNYLDQLYGHILMIALNSDVLEV